jgi:hypothetical protein
MTTSNTSAVADTPQAGTPHEQWGAEWLASIDRQTVADLLADCADPAALVKRCDVLTRLLINHAAVLQTLTVESDDVLVLVARSRLVARAAEQVMAEAQTLEKRWFDGDIDQRMEALGVGLSSVRECHRQAEAGIE